VGKIRKIDDFAGKNCDVFLDFANKTCGYDHGRHLMFDDSLARQDTYFSNQELRSIGCETMRVSTSLRW
jgi:hypothetical protein